MPKIKREASERSVKKLLNKVFTTITVKSKRRAVKPKGSGEYKSSKRPSKKAQIKASL